MSNFYLVYASSATRLPSNEELLEILRVSRANNPEKDITGLLLYHDGNFIQALEGPEANVRAVYNKIASDKKHRGVQLLMQGYSEERLFPNWAMGFQNIDQLKPEENPGLSDFLTEPFDSAELMKNPHRVYIMLLTFRDSLRRF